MKQRGRKSEASLQVAELAPKVGRPPPPDYLTDEQALIWRRIVDCERPGFIKSSQFGLLANYCVLEDLSRRLDLDDANERKELRQISHEMTSIARSLRLTNQSRYTPETAARKSETSEGPRPWEWKHGVP